jgi:hypothetical protein
VLSVFEWQRAISRSRLSWKARLVALTLSLRMDFDTFECWPSLGRIEAETGLSRRSVQRGLRELRGHGYLFMHRQKGRAGGANGKTNLYVARLPTWWDEQDDA